MSPYTPGEDDVVAGPARPRAGRPRRRLPRLRRDAARPARRRSAALVEGPVTIEYPEEKTPVYPRFRGRHKLHRFEDTGLEKCVGCSLCAAACPADCIRVVAAENTPDNQVSAGERYAAVYEINMTRCIFCGYCEVACPFDAITMGNDYELADYSRSRPDLHEGDAARRPARAHAAAARGRVAPACGSRTSSSSSPRSARSAARSASSCSSNPFYSVLVAGRAPARAGGAVPAAARGVPRGRAGDRLRGRGDGALRVRGRLRRRLGRAARPERGPARARSAPLFAVALGVELCIAILGIGPQGARHRRAPDVGAGLRLARRRSASCSSRSS